MGGLTRALLFSLCICFAAGNFEESKAVGHERSLSEGTGAAAAATAAAEAAAKALKEKKETKNYDSALLFSLLVTFMVAYYLVNSPFSAVRQQTWSLILNTTAIFIAVTGYAAIKNLAEVIFGLAKDAKGEHAAAAEGAAAAAASSERRLLDFRMLTSEGAHHVPVTGKLLACSLTVFLVLCLLILIMLFLQRYSKLRLRVWSTIGGHILGFAAIDFFGGTLAHFGVFSSHPAMHFVVFVIFFVSVGAVCGIMFAFAKCFGYGNELDEMVDEMCEDFFALSGGFIVAMIVRGFIMYNRTGKAAEKHATVDHPIQETALLYTAGFVFLFVGICLLFAKKVFNDMGPLRVFFRIVTSTLLMTSSWCFLGALTWTWLKQYPVHQVMGRLMIAVTGVAIFVIVLILTIIVLTCTSINAKDPDVLKTLKGIYMVIGLIVALSWEHTFDVALEAGMEGSKFGETQKKMVGALIGFVLVLFFLPGYGVHMMPAHDDQLEEYRELKQLKDEDDQPVKDKNGTAVWVKEAKRFHGWQVFFDFPFDESTELGGDGSYREAAEDEDMEDPNWE